jgi:hypothetical protein
VALALKSHKSTRASGIEVPNVSMDLV